jgi:urea transport system permease protein
MQMSSRSLRSLAAGWAAPALILALLLIAPIALEPFRLSLLGKFVAYAIAALALDLIWGYSGI